MSAARVTRVERLELRGFRNLEALSLEPGAQFNILSGDNGAGKSNLLEAIDYLASLRSFRSARTDDLIQVGQPAAQMKAVVGGDLARRELTVRLLRGSARRLSLDSKRPRSIASWHTAVQMVLFHPGHLDLASGAPERRREFADRILEQFDPTYASALASYVKALRSRNRLLKDERPNRASIRAFDELLANAGALVGEIRARLVEELAPLSEQAFAEVTDRALPLTIRYAPRVEPTAEGIRKALERSLDKDLARGFTADGPHGDDLVFQVSDEVPDRTARHHASQGQQRALVLALKIAELRVLTRRTGRVPVLLLDDVSSELDRTRNRRFFELLQGIGAQVFLSTTHPEFILLEQGRTDITVDTGRVFRTELPHRAPK